MRILSLCAALVRVIPAFAFASYGCQLTANGEDPQSDGAMQTPVGPVIAHDPGPAPAPVIAHDPGPTPVPVIAHDPGPTPVPVIAHDPGPVPSTTSTPPTIPNAVCLTDSMREVEPNDILAAANDMQAKTSFCGSVPPGDVDYVSFILPADATGLAYRANWSGPGTPAIALTSEGVTTVGGQTPGLNSGKAYVFRVTGGAAQTDYVIAVNIAH
jgi:hypothetical protein